MKENKNAQRRFLIAAWSLLPTALPWADFKALVCDQNPGAIMDEQTSEIVGRLWAKNAPPNADRILNAGSPTGEWQLAN